tara:strand:- start:108895 stop:109335 length:441 start_codon:yes stop_codon:yes gene_type:complete
MDDALSWAPQRAVFVRRSLRTAVITFAALACVGLGTSLAFDLPLSWITPTAFLLSLGFLIEDFMRWRTSRFDRWQISDHQLRHDGPDGRASVPLSEVANVFARFGNRVVIELHSGQRVMLRDLPYPVETARQIEAARLADGGKVVG